MIDKDDAMILKPELLTVEDAKGLTAAETVELFCEYMNPGQLHFLKLLGFHKVIIESAEGMYYIDKDGRKFLISLAASARWLWTQPSAYS